MRGASMEQYMKDAIAKISIIASETKKDLDRIADELAIEKFWIFEVFKKEFGKAIKNE